MSQSETNDRTESENVAAPQECRLRVTDASHGARGPHCASHSPRVLARVPDLESAEPEVAEEGPVSDGEGRMLSSGLSVKILAGGGGLLLLAALGLPFLFSNSDTSEPASKDKMSAWEPEKPALSAPMAPTWDGMSGGGASWQLPTGADTFPRPEMPATAAWNEDSQPSGWDAHPQAQPWTDFSEAQPWGDQPPTEVGSREPDTAPSPAQPQWQDPGNQANTPTWNDQADVAAGAEPTDQAGWSTQPNATPGIYEQPTTSWNQQPQIPSWQVPPYSVAGQATARATAPAGYDLSYQPADSYQQPQADTNRSMTIGGHSPAGTSAYQTDSQHRLQNEQGVYRAADARTNSPGAGRVDHRAGYRSTYPQSSYPPTDRSLGASATPRPGAEAYTPYSEPGVARFQGGIEKPTESDGYERDRSSVY